MMHLVADIVKHFSFDDINIDNWVFKLFYKGTFVLFLMGSMVGILSQYFGEPINCDFKGIDSEMASDYCWIHGSSYIPPEYQQHMKCIVDLDGVKSADDAPDTSYYQWVTFVMMFQAGTFMLPYKIWKALEGGMLEEFGMDAKSAIMLREEFDDAIVLDAVIEKYVKYFKSVLHRNTYYFWKFVVCEGLNVIILFVNFYVTDQFLNGNFWYYGWDVIKYARLDPLEQKISVNPFCQAFPLEVSCTVPNVGAAGGEQNHNGLCVLSQNIINEKMYLAVWFWMVFMIFIIPFCIFYRVLTILFDGFRSALLMSRIGNTNDKLTRKAIKGVMTKCYLGDWFLLYQISKNVNMYFFRAFLKELNHEIGPKKSKQAFIDKDKVSNHLPSSIVALPPIEEGESKKLTGLDSDDEQDAEEPRYVEAGKSPVLPKYEDHDDSPTEPLHHVVHHHSRRPSKAMSETPHNDEEEEMRNYLKAPGNSSKLMLLPGKRSGKLGNRRSDQRKSLDDFDIDMMMLM